MDEFVCHLSSVIDIAKKFARSKIVDIDLRQLLQKCLEVFIFEPNKRICMKTEGGFV